MPFRMLIFIEKGSLKRDHWKGILTGEKKKNGEFSQQASPHISQKYFRNREISPHPTVLNVRKSSGFKTKKKEILMLETRFHPNISIKEVWCYAMVYFFFLTDLIL